MPKRYYRTSVTLPQETMETIFELLKNEDAHHFQTVEIGPENPHHPRHDGAVTIPINSNGRPLRGFFGKMKPDTEKWALGFWPKFEPLFRSSGSVRYDDQRAVQIMLDCGRSPSTVTTLFTAFVRAGKIIRCGRGEYTLAK